MVKAIRRKVYHVIFSDWIPAANFGLITAILCVYRVISLAPKIPLRLSPLGKRHTQKTQIMPFTPLSRATRNLGITPRYGA